MKERSMIGQAVGKEGGLVIDRKCKQRNINLLEKGIHEIAQGKATPDEVLKEKGCKGGMR